MASGISRGTAGRRRAAAAPAARAAGARCHTLRRTPLRRPGAASARGARPTAAGSSPSSRSRAAPADGGAGGPAAAAAGESYRDKPPQEVRVAVFGATGYIGRFVVRELVARGYDVVAVTRGSSGIGGKQGVRDVEALFPGGTVVQADVQDAAAVGAAVFGDRPADVVVSCLASRTGGKKDSWAIDYQATLNTLDAARAAGAQHYVLLSAICVQKPLLEFQKAKLKLEAALEGAGDITYSIVRPTAFFKSLGGQVESVKGGGPYVWFGDGELASCKPISEADLARFMADCVADADKVNRVLPVGGPGEALSPKQQADLLFGLLGPDAKRNTFPVPVALMDGIIGLLDFLNGTIGRFFPQLEDAAEFGRIGKYYATESMLVYDPATGEYDAAATPSYGTDTLEDFFKKVLKDGMAGQELGDQAVFSQK